MHAGDLRQKWQKPEQFHRKLDHVMKKCKEFTFKEEHDMSEDESQREGKHEAAAAVRNLNLV